MNVEKIKCTYCGKKIYPFQSICRFHSNDSEKIPVKKILNEEEKEKLRIYRMEYKRKQRKSKEFRVRERSQAKEREWRDFGKFSKYKLV